MKRLFILATAAIVALASCSKTQVVYTDAPEEIGFKAVTGAMTKADLGDDVHLGVFAEYEDAESNVSSYFDNIEFVKTDGVWKGNQYWPKDGTLHFTFYAPYKNGKAEYIDNAKNLTLTIDDNGTDQTDYLVGKTRPSGTSGEVAIELQHALASVKVTVIADVASLYNITSLVLNDTKQAGTLTCNYSSDLVVTPSDASGEKAFTLISSGTPVTTSATAVGNEEGYLVFPSEATSLTLHYTINGAPQTKTINLDETWEPGKQYTYGISFGATEITVRPTVDNWTTGQVTTDATI